MNEDDARLISGGYWDSSDDFPVEDWQYEVANGDTRQGYHEWRTNKQEEVQYENNTKRFGS